MNNKIDKRLHPRIPLNWPVFLTTSQGAIEGRTTNISLGGMAVILLADAPQKENEIEAVLKMPPNLEIQLGCEMIWSDNISTNGSVYKIIGVSFAKTSATKIEIIDSMISEYFGD